MLLMVEKGIAEGICHAIHKCSKANNKYMKAYNKNEETSYLKYWNVNNLYDWAMSQKLPVNNFKWIEDTSIMKKVTKDIFSNLMFSILKKYMSFIMIYHFYQKE